MPSSDTASVASREAEAVKLEEEYGDDFEDEASTPLSAEIAWWCLALTYAILLPGRES